MKHEELEKYCKLIHHISGKEIVEKEEVSNNVVSDYYSKSAFFYKKFHSKEGAMHLPISFSNKDSHTSKLLYQADSIHNTIQEHGFSKVLELGCGMGFNSTYLAEKNPNVKFTGVDLTPNNIKEAQNNAKELSNNTFRQMDLVNLADLEDKYDIILAVENLFHSHYLVQVIAKISRRLNYYGKIYIYYCYVRFDSVRITYTF